MRRRAALMGLGLLVAASPVVLYGAGARAADAPAANLGGYRLSSTASGVGLLYNDGSQVNLTIPSAETDGATGIGHALSAPLYPGSVGGNPGATIKQFLGAHLPPQISDALGTLSDPAKAEAYASGPNDSSFPPGGPPQALTDTAHASPDAGQMSASGTFVNVGGLTSAATSVTDIGASAVTTTATSTVSDLSIAGLVHIGEIKSVATAKSDGTTGTVSGSTTLAGLTVAGMTVGLDTNGINVGPIHAPLNLGGVLNPVLKALGIQIFVSPETHSVKGAMAVEHAPALTIFVAPPQNGGNTFFITVGGAQAQAVASQSFQPTVPPPSSGGGAVPPSSSGGGSGGVIASPSSTSGGGQSSPSQTALSPSTSTRPVALATATSVGKDKGIAAGLVVFGLLIGAAGAFGLGKVRDDVFAEAAVASPCPLERSEP